MAYNGPPAASGPTNVYAQPAQPSYAYGSAPPPGYAGGSPRLSTGQPPQQQYAQPYQYPQQQQQQPHYAAQQPPPYTYPPQPQVVVHDGGKAPAYPQVASAAPVVESYTEQMEKVCGRLNFSFSDRSVIEREGATHVGSARRRVLTHWGAICTYGWLIV